MSALTLGVLALPVLLALIFLGLPIGPAMLVVGVGGTWLIQGSLVPILAQFKTLPYEVFSTYSLSVVPLFVLMGQFAAMGGLSAALFEAAAKWVGHRRGGLAMAAIVACAGFGAICGSSLATAGTMGRVALPQLQRFGYSGALATGTLAAGGTLGILIPPSVILVIYAVLTSQNIAWLFLAALVPGVLAAVGYAIAIAVLVRLRPQEAGERLPPAPLSQRIAALRAAWPAGVLFVVVIGGIYAGVFTPTEAAAIGALGTGLVALASGNLDARGLGQALLATATTTAMIFMIVLGAEALNTFLALSQLPRAAADMIAGQNVSPWLVLVLLLGGYLVLGCVMDSLSMILLTIPLVFPVMAGLDFGLPPDAFALWFGVLILIVVEAGLITPPVGMNLFVINAMSPATPMSATYRGVVPFIVSDIVRVALLAAFPAITLAAVNLVYGPI